MFKENHSVFAADAASSDFV